MQCTLSDSHCTVYYSSIRIYWYALLWLSLLFLTFYPFSPPFFSLSRRIDIAINGPTEKSRQRTKISTERHIFRIIHPIARHFKPINKRVYIMILVYIDSGAVM